VTAIVGLVDSGRVYIGGDSAGVAGHSLTVRADAKVFRNGAYLFGFTTSFRMGQLIRYSLEAPVPVGDLEGFMATTFIDAVRTCLKDGGWARKDSDREEGGTFLVGAAGRLFAVYEDYQVAEAADGYAAVGCGSDIALGALYASARTRTPAGKRVALALEAAERFSAGVRGPFICLAAGKRQAG
jgi:ATP-dependent protease HslVU (ClpYQ) peptidase subunit